MREPSLLRLTFHKILYNLSEEFLLNAESPKECTVSLNIFALSCGLHDVMIQEFSSMEDPFCNMEVRVERFLKNTIEHSASCAKLFLGPQSPNVSLKC